MRRELARIARLPRTARLPFSTTPPETASRVVAGLVSLPNHLNLDEVSTVMSVVRHPERAGHQKPDLGYSTADIDTTMQLIQDRMGQGLLATDIGQKFLDSLNDQRELSLQRPPTLSQRIGSKVLPAVRVARQHVTRRRSFLVGGLAAAIYGASLVAPRMGELGIGTAPEILDSDEDRRLDHQPKGELTTSPTDLSKLGWLAKAAPDGVLFKPSTDKPEVYMLNNGFSFQFGNEKNAITLRALKTGERVVPFLRVYPVEGTPRDYVIHTRYDQVGNLVTEVVVFENPTTQKTFFAQFSPLPSGNTVKFTGRYMDPVGG